MSEIQEIKRKYLFYDQERNRYYRKKIPFLEIKTEEHCPECQNFLFYAEPKDYKTFDFSSTSEPAFLDNLYCKTCKKTFFLLDAFVHFSPFFQKKESEKK